MSKEQILEEQISEFEKERKEIEKKIRNTKILLRHLKAKKNFKEMVFKKNKKGKIKIKW